MKFHSKEDVRKWKNLEDAGGRHELPSNEAPCGSGRLWFFEDAGNPSAGYFTRTILSFARTSFA